MAKADDRLNEWLRDAHAAAEQAVTVFKGTANRNDDYPEFSHALLEQSKAHEGYADELAHCLEERGASTSLIKQATGQISALGQNLSGLVVGDELVKGALAISTFAQMEVSSFLILVAAAEQAQDPATRKICESILSRTEDFADWIEDELPELTREYLEREAAETNADA